MKTDVAAERRLVDMTVGDLIEIMERRDSILRRELIEAVKAGQESPAMKREEFVGITEASEIVHRSVGTLYRLTSTGEIPHRKHRGRLLFSRKELDEWAKGQRVPMKRDIEFEAGKYMRR